MTFSVVIVAPTSMRAMVFSTPWSGNCSVSSANAFSLALSQSGELYNLTECRLEHRNGDRIEGAISVTGNFGVDPLQADMSMTAELPTSNPLNNCCDTVGTVKMWLQGQDN